MALLMNPVYRNVQTMSLRAIRSALRPILPAHVNQIPLTITTNNVEPNLGSPRPSEMSIAPSLGKWTTLKLRAMEEILTLEVIPRERNQMKKRLPPSRSRRSRGKAGGRPKPIRNYDVKRNRLDLLCLMETKVNIQPNQNQIRKVGFHNIIFSPSCGSKGGIWVLWRSNFSTLSLSLNLRDKNFVSLNYKIANLDIIIIFVYVPCRDVGTENFWTTIKHHIFNTNKPCMIIGDLNDILLHEDKLGGATPLDGHFSRLSNIMIHLGLVDTRFSGFPFTWRKSRIMSNNILERLDRVLCHSSIVSLVPNILTIIILSPCLTTAS
ncbi:hypothetical protein V2J09_006650 [Rumex salicifolius]